MTLSSPQRHSPLADALRRLQNLRSSVDSIDDSCETAFRCWQAQWQRQKDLIARRLAFIDSALSRIDSASVPVPHLTIIGRSGQRTGTQVPARGETKSPTDQRQTTSSADPQ